MSLTSIRSGYYNHVFLKISSETITKFGLLDLSINNSQCTVTISGIKTEKIIDTIIESPLHSSTYSIEFLDKLIDRLSTRGNITTETLKYHDKLPVLINWLEIDSEIIYIVYAKIGDEKPWILASSYPYPNNIDRRIKAGFLIILPQSIAQKIKSACLSDRGRSIIIRVDREGVNE